MFRISTCFSLCVLLTSLASSGCVQKPSTNNFKAFEVDELDACLGILIDLSGSFRDEWEKDGRAHRLFLNLMGQFFDEGIGLESRVVIGQISANENVVLFDGSVSEFMNKFQSPEALNEFLRTHSDPAGSKVYDAMTKMLDYLAAIPEKTDRTRTTTVVLSDLNDSESDETAWLNSGKAMFNALKTYAASGGGMAIYFVAQDEKQQWLKRMKLVGFEPGDYVVESGLVETPTLPKFD